jgi:hypothetical protein
MFGARLALVRQRMKWGNVKEAAVACGLPTESWRSWERDGRSPRNIVEIASIIAAATGCDYLWLLAGQRIETEGRYVTVAGNRAGAGAVQTTDPNFHRTVSAGPRGREDRTGPSASSRRPARLSLRHP